MSGWARYYDERIETMPPAWARRLEDERLAEQVAFCYERAPFYQRKLDEAGVRPERINGREDLPLLPFTTREELRESQSGNPPFGDFVCVDQLDVVRAELASDTDGMPILIAYTDRDLATSAELGARAIWACGVRPDDVVVHGLDSFHSGSLSNQAALEATGATTIAFDLGESVKLLELGADLRPTALFSTFADTAHLAETALGQGIDPRALGLSKLIIRGVPGGEVAGTRARLGEQWDATVADCYGLPEGWRTLAGECEERQGLHFLGQGATLVELVDPESNDPRPIAPGAQGELVFSHLDREATPLLRFRSGDVATIVDVECPCGRTGFRFRMAGRNGDTAPMRRGEQAPA